uniref:Uncharacterized protein n=1 Tax=Oryza nivara TaxID=4536 RepID=A0A0E0I343_ORYNI
MTYRSTAPARAGRGGVWWRWGGAERGARGGVSSVRGRPRWSVSAAGRHGARWSEELRIKGRRSIPESSRGGWEESEAPAAAVHAGRISSEDAAVQRQNIRGGGGASKEEEKRSLRVWSDVFAGGGGVKYSAWRGWMDRAVVKSSAQMDGRDRFE